MVFAYGMLATVCAIETFGYMTNPSKYVAMVSEYVTYTIILALLFRHHYFIHFFKVQ